MKGKKTGIYIPSGRKPWEHELRVAEVLALAGHYAEFLPDQGNIPTADIRLDGIEYEIKTPRNFNPNTLEHTIHRAIKQSPNLIIDTSRMKKVHDDQVRNFLAGQARKAKVLKRMLMITKQGKIIDIFAFI